MEQLDKYRILETDLTKWEKKCESLKGEAMAAPIEGSCGVVYGASNDIHNKVNFKKTNNLGQNTLNSLKPSYSNVVLPLQYNTNEYQISNSRFPEVKNFGSSFHEANFSLHVGVHSNTSLLNSDDLTADSSSQQNLLYNSGICLGNAYLNNIGVCQAYQTENAAENVHSGAPPPWLEVADRTLLNNQVKPALSRFMSSNKSWKSHKLNPKRVGAASAEKRKMELEKEKQGEIVESDCDAN
ncbi:Coiled-coil domain-containing protein 84 [Hibiscus syriacus]|uniref:Coiled-coil domain-containing protein 84 n=1 Tax=Hibiscus syriacus TaxID=106335 RepID=A0A6A2ZBR2_HIBSY|nr:Coiled-coil domain-containing protein 84 [Hibiscus syriacus]